MLINICEVCYFDSYVKNKGKLFYVYIDKN